MSQTNINQQKYLIKNQSKTANITTIRLVENILKKQKYWVYTSTKGFKFFDKKVNVIANKPFDELADIELIDALTLIGFEMRTTTNDVFKETNPIKFNRRRELTRDVLKIYFKIIDNQLLLTCGVEYYYLKEKYPEKVTLKQPVKMLTHREGKQSRFGANIPKKGK